MLTNTHTSFYNSLKRNVADTGMYNAVMTKTVADIVANGGKCSSITKPTAKRRFTL